MVGFEIVGSIRGDGKTALSINAACNIDKVQLLSVGQEITIPQIGTSISGYITKVERRIDNNNLFEIEVSGIQEDGTGKYIYIVPADPYSPPTVKVYDSNLPFPLEGKWLRREDELNNRHFPLSLRQLHRHPVLCFDRPTGRNVGEWLNLSRDRIFDGGKPLDFGNYNETTSRLWYGNTIYTHHGLKRAKRWLQNLGIKSSDKVIYERSYYLDFNTIVNSIVEIDFVVGSGEYFYDVKRKWILCFGHDEILLFYRLHK